MEDELEAFWKKLSLTEEEDEQVVLGSNSTKAAKELGRNYLVMKVLSRRSISLDALRKNLRMVWKTNKSVQISELEDEVFMVEFGDGRDKKKIMEMRPWSYEKQLIILQDFEGEQTPKEVVLKWTPFWIQIHNLPLKSRTKETGYSIGATIGEVVEVDVTENRVQWEKCLRVRVMVDVTRRLIKGKRVTIEGVEGRWVQFKYERLPNFCYQCGLLNHDMKDCIEVKKNGDQSEMKELQYGAWLRGDVFRKPVKETDQAGRREPMDKAEEVNRGRGFQMELATKQAGGEVTEENRSEEGLKRRSKNSGSTIPTHEDVDKKKTPNKPDEVVQGSVFIHERGKVSQAEESTEIPLPILGYKHNLEKEARGKGKDEMQWEIVTTRQEVPKFVFNEGQTDGECQGEPKPDRADAAQEPMAMTYKNDVGWVAECLGPKSGHWKRMAREVRPKDFNEQQSPSGVKPIIKNKVKRESPVPVQELERNITEIKRNRGCKEGRAIGKEITNTDGGEATTATQCRRAQ